MVANTVRTNTRMFRNRYEIFYLLTGKMPPKKKTIAKTLTFSRVNPSGKKEESFFLQVYDIVRQIPKGRVTSYGAIANCLGTKLSARMVGWAMNAAHTAYPPRARTPGCESKRDVIGKASFCNTDENGIAA